MSVNRRIAAAAVRRRLMEYLEDADATLCNCAKCAIDLLSVESYQSCVAKGVPKGVIIPDAVGGRHEDRPYCSRCLQRAQNTTRHNIGL